MSQGNVETLKRAFEAWNRRDLELFLDLHDAAFEVVPLAPGGPYHGRDGVLRWWEDSFAVFSDMSAEIVEIRDLETALLLALRLHGRGRYGHVPFQQMRWAIVAFRDEKILSWRTYHSEKEALEAVGAASKPCSRRGRSVW
jgi:ketosteroid isomerase-like protein